MNYSILRALVVMSLSLGAFACVTEVSLPSETGGTQTGAGGAAASASSSGGVGGAGGATPCVPQPKDPGAGFTEPTCADLAVIIVSDPVVKDDSGDGKVSPGEGVTVHVRLSEIAGKGFNAYPGVTFTSELATVSDPGSAQLYAILACQVDELVTHLVMPAGVAKGTVVNVKAQVSMLSTACPDAYAITIPITIE